MLDHYKKQIKKTTEDPQPNSKGIMQLLAKPLLPKVCIYLYHLNYVNFKNTFIIFEFTDLQKEKNIKKYIDEKFKDLKGQI